MAVVRAATLVATLRARGVTVEARGDRLRLYPADKLTEAEVAMLQAEKTEVLRLVAAHHEGDKEAAPTLSPSVGLHASGTVFHKGDKSLHTALSPSGDPSASAMLTGTLVPADEACAWRVYSHRLHRELWIARDEDALRELIADGALEGLPAIAVADVEKLRELDDTMLGKVLDVCAAMPGARVADVMGGRTRQ